MGSTERRAREREDVRRRILDAAHDLFAKEGYEAVTMRRVAEMIEYTPPAIYFHFKDKLELIQALAQEDFVALAQELATLGEVTNPWERLAQVGRTYVDFAAKNPNHYRLMFMTKLPPEVVKHDDANKGVPARDAYALVRHLSSDAIAQKCLRDEYHDPDLVAQVLWSAMHGIASLSITMCDSPWIQLRSARVLTASMIDSLMQGMAAPSLVPASTSAKKKPRPSRPRS